MNFRKLKIFYETANCLNMTKVAKDMFISQPSISQSIHELETEVGIKLFDRIGKKIYLTHEGEVFLNYSRRILNLYDEGIKTLSDFNKNNKGKIVIGASTTIGIYILPEILRNFSELFPEIEISLVIENTHHIELLILENKIDFAFIEGDILSEEITKEYIWKDELVFICSKNHRFKDLNIVDSSELSKERFITRELGSGSAQQVTKFLNANKIHLNTYLELGSTEAIKKIVANNFGIGCVSIRSIKGDSSSNDLNCFKVKEGNITRNLFLIYHKDKFLSNIMKSFIEISKEYDT